VFLLQKQVIFLANLGSFWNHFFKIKIIPVTFYASDTENWMFQELLIDGIGSHFCF